MTRACSPLRRRAHGGSAENFGIGRLLLLLLLATICAAQQPPVIRSTTEEVMLDVVVRDKKGKAIRGLGPTSFEVFDNGVKQTIRSVRMVEGGEVAGVNTAVAVDPLRQIRLVTLAFERLAPEGRRVARQAALDLLKSGPAQNVFYSVMTIDQRLSVLQPFTADTALLRKAVERATSGAYADFAADSARIKAQLANQIGATPDGRSQAEQLREQADASSRNPAQSQMSQVMLNMLQFNESMDREQAAHSSIFSLMSMVRGQTSLPGRKTILHFSEGLRVPVSVDAPFRALISTANRANVTFYAIDSRGLVSGGENAAAASELRAAAEQSKQVMTDAGGRAVTPEQVKAGDRAEESMKANLLTALRDLSESTGGFLIANSNDLRGPLRMVNEEISSYYEITYSPRIESYDGRFRKTDVRLTSGDGHVQGRSGYFALPPESGGTVRTYEAALLRALGTTPLPKDVDFRSAAVRFQEDASLVVDVPLKSLTFTEDKAANTYSARVSLAALVKNAQGEVVKKFDRDVPLRGPLDRLAAVKEAHFVYKTPFRVPPGRYTVETAVLDGEGTRVGARRSVFVEAAKSGGVGISNISVVRRFEPNATELDEDPFQMRGGRITPELGASAAGGKGRRLSLFFVIYTGSAIPEKPQAMIEYVLDGQVVGQGTVELDAPDANGRIPCVMSSPTENMKPGAYEVRVVVKQGGSTAEERTVVTIESAEKL